MTRPLQTICDAPAAATVSQDQRQAQAKQEKGAPCASKLLRGVFGGKRLQPFHPENGHLVFLRFKHRDRRVRAQRGIDPRVQDMGEILRLVGWTLLPQDEKCADAKDRERRGAHPNQPAQRPQRGLRAGLSPGQLRRARRLRSARAVDDGKTLRCPSRDAGVVPSGRRRACARRASPLPRRLCPAGKLQTRPARLPQLAVEPRRPLFLKRFHKHLSTDSAASCARRKAAT